MPFAPAVRFDPAEPEDLPAAWGVYLACSDPAARDGSRRPDPNDLRMPPRVYPHLLATSEGGFWVARSDDRIVGFAAAIPRGDTWFLSELWVAPEHRGNGIGTRLFQLVRRSTRGARGKVRAAMAGDDGGGLVIGLRDGMLARYPVFRVVGEAGAAARLWRARRGGRGVRQVRYDPSAPVGPRSPLLRLDRQMRGAARPQDHAFWLAEPDRAGFLLWMESRPVAYFYVNRAGEVGPLAATGPAALQQAVRHAVKEAIRGAERVTLRVPAPNRGALEALLAAGFRLVGGGLLVSTGEIGRPDGYLPVDDSLF